MPGYQILTRPNITAPIKYFLKYATDAREIENVCRPGTKIVELHGIFIFSTHSEYIGIS